MKHLMKHLHRGFTLVELLIVVIILAILAAIVIPQFSSSTVDAQEAALDANLNTMRSAIELYQAQHGGRYPGADTAVAAACSVGAPGAGLAGSALAVTEQLTTYSSAAGTTCTGPATQTPLGPYLRRGIPADPITNNAAIVVTTTGAVALPVAATGGWTYDTLSGRIIMNSNALDRNGAAFSTH